MNEYQEQLANRDALLAQAGKLDQAKDYKALMEILDRIVKMSKASDMTANLDQQFLAEVDAANGRVSESESRMQFWYFVATALLLLSSVAGSVLLELTLRKIVRQNAVKVIQPKQPKASRSK